MAARILMVVTVLMALYVCGHSLQTKDSFEAIEPLDHEASAFSTVVLTGQNVELGSDVVDQADRDGGSPDYAYLECGYSMPCDTASASASASAVASALVSSNVPQYEVNLDAFFRPATFKLVFAVPVIGPVCALELTLIEWLHS